MLLPRRAQEHLTILIENDESADRSCPQNFDAAVNDLTLKMQSAVAASTANGNHSSVPQLINALFNPEISSLVTQKRSLRPLKGLVHFKKTC